MLHLHHVLGWVLSVLLLTMFLYWHLHRLLLIELLTLRIIAHHGLLHLLLHHLIVLHILIHLRRLGHLRLLLLTHLHSRLHRLEHLLLLHERLLHRILPTILHHRHLHSCWWLCIRRLTSFCALLLFFLFLFFWCWRWSSCRRGFGSIWFTSSSCSLDLGVALLSFQSCLKRCLSASSTS